MKDNLIKSNWPRFSRYQIKNGFIYPIKTSKFFKNNDPWENYWKTHKSNNQKNIIDELFNILKKVEQINEINLFDDNFLDIDIKLNNQIENLIIEWVNKYGLLGILHHNIKGITYCAMWYFFYDSLKTTPPKKRNFVLAPLTMSFNYSYGSWIFEKENFKLKNNNYKKFDINQARKLDKKKIDNKFISIQNYKDFYPTALEFDSLSHFNKSISVNLCNNFFGKIFLLILMKLMKIILVIH